MGPILFQRQQVGYHVLHLHCAQQRLTDAITSYPGQACHPVKRRHHGLFTDAGRVHDLQPQFRFGQASRHAMQRWADVTVKRLFRNRRGVAGEAVALPSGHDRAATRGITYLTAKRRVDATIAYGKPCDRVGTLLRADRNQGAAGPGDRQQKGRNMI